jgi:hypothetical protein
MGFIEASREQKVFCGLLTAFWRICSLFGTHFQILTDMRYTRKCLRQEEQVMKAAALWKGRGRELTDPGQEVLTEERRKGLTLIREELRRPALRTTLLIFLCFLLLRGPPAEAIMNPYPR